MANFQNEINKLSSFQFYRRPILTAGKVQGVAMLVMFQALKNLNTHIVCMCILLKEIYLKLS